MIRSLIGENAYAVRQRTRQLKTEFIQKYGSDGIEQFDGESVEWPVLETALFGVSLFAPQKLVFINDVSSNKTVCERLVERLKDVGKGTEVIFLEKAPDKRTAFYKYLKKSTELEEFAPLGDNDAANWVQGYVQSLEGKITSANARRLVEYAGVDQSRLKNELDKLLDYTPEITAENIDLLVDKLPRDTVFELLQLALTKQADRAVDKLASLQRAQEDPFQLMGMVIWQVNILAIVAAAGNEPAAQIAKDFKLNPFVIQKTMDLKRRMNMKEVKRIVGLVAEADLQLKSESVEAWDVLKQLVLEIGQ